MSECQIIECVACRKEAEYQCAICGEWYCFNDLDNKECINCIRREMRE